MRDTTFTLQALHWLNLNWEADEFMEFVADVEPTRTGRSRSCGIDGRRDLTESTQDDLSGCARGTPVRIGSRAFDQRQNDVFGAVLDSIFLHTRHSGRLPRRLWPIVQSQAECATRAWREPDQGIWEARGAPQQYVSSKLMCWVAMDRAAKLAELGGDPRRPRLAHDRRGDPRGHPGTRRQRPRRHAPALQTDALDASVLLAAIFIPPGRRQRMRNTVLAIAEELTEDGFVLRYKTEETDDGSPARRGRSRSARSGWCPPSRVRRVRRAAT
jgi:GH15 family glucan-1,4-alpha-glucosidase